MNPDRANEALREWADSAPYWEKHAPTIRSMFAPVTAALIDEAGIVFGHTVLDVAGGAGEPSLTIAEVVGPTGSVTYTDPIAKMVSAAESEARRRALTNIRFCQCPADGLPFESRVFDAVVSRLGIMFFPDPLAALREMLRVTKPGGALSLVVWGKSEDNPFSYVVTNTASRYVTPSSSSEGSPDAFRFAETGKLLGLLTEAGAFNVRERLFKFHIAVPISFEEFWQMRSETSGTLRDKLASLSAQDQESIKREVLAASQEFFPNNLMCFPGQMLIVTGNRKRD